jgi:hypothetical protein
MVSRKKQPMPATTPMHYEIISRQEETIRRLQHECDMAKHQWRQDETVRLLEVAMAENVTLTRSRHKD